MFFVFAYVDENQDETSFEEKIPLLFLGRSLRLHSSKEVFNILFLDGYDRLCSQYIRKLKTLGLGVINLSHECRRLVRAFPSLERFGKFEMFCFLRWPLLAHYLKMENIRGQVFHIDGDVIFSASPEEIANDLEGLTLVLQGCPAFVTITN